MNSVLLVDKPSGLTSHDVVNRARRILQQRSIGHLGTLDPLATGVLPLVTGSFTRLAQFYTHSEKSYEGVIRFGFATTTYDADGDPIETSFGPEGKSAWTTNVGTITGQVGTAALGCHTTALNSKSPMPDAFNLATLRQLAAEFVGTIQQVPPPFSAKKINGVPAYKLARKNREVSLAPVQVEIKEFTITALEEDRATFRARVSSGTYLRSVAHELGQRLGNGAHLASLRRTALAEFTLAQAHSLQEIEHAIKTQESANSSTNTGSASGSSERSGCHSEPGRRPGEEPAFSSVAANPKALFVHPRQLLPQFPSITADEETAARIRHGRPVNLPDFSRARHVKVFADQNTLIAIATRVAGTLFHPKIVFPAE